MSRVRKTREEEESAYLAERYKKTESGNKMLQCLYY